ncbi:hypothetical protein [Variovorax sp. Root434]|uniref:hypothetical protein n=1 Tax=Variovorax sp. Root434 TaxID=1736536 RepID=UPI0006F6E9D4|nr:hypothetical protein [Variovorax sp. Root434]KQX30030.1 hypothetical protein ASD05_07960 [Variovorax sp. Root434]
MAKRIMAGPARPASADATTARDPSDLLENKLEQLNSLLWCFYGAGDGWFQDAGEAHRENLLWIASDLAREAVELYQEMGPVG